MIVLASSLIECFVLFKLLQQNWFQLVTGSRSSRSWSQSLMTSCPLTISSKTTSPVSLTTSTPECWHRRIQQDLETFKFSPYQKILDFIPSFVLFVLFFAWDVYFLVARPLSCCRKHKLSTLIIRSFAVILSRHNKVPWNILYYFQKQLTYPAAPMTSVNFPVRATKACQCK